MVNDASFRGRPAEYWLHARLSGDDEARWEAIDAIRHICPPDESVRLFLDTLHTDSYWRARALAAHALYDLALDRSEVARLVAVMPQLLAALNDSSANVREQIAELLEVLDSNDEAA